MMSCGAIGWMPPPETGGMVDRYSVRFFTGDSMETTPFSERELQRLFNNSEGRFTKADNLPSDCSTVLYAQVLLYYQMLLHIICVINCAIIILLI